MNNKNRLPVIVLLEEHVDHISYQQYANIFFHLQSLGYDTLCFEAPKSEGVPGLKNFLVGRIKLTNGLVQSILEILNSATANTKDIVDGDDTSTCASHLDKVKNSQGQVTKEMLLALNYKNLSKIFNCYLADAPGVDMVDQVLRLKSQELWYNNLELFANIMNMHTIDSDAPEDAEAPSNLESRNLDMVTNLIGLYKDGYNIIFPVGKLHFPGIVNLLDEQNLLSNTLFFDLNSPSSALDCGRMTASSQIFADEISHSLMPINSVWFDIFNTHVDLKVTEELFKERIQRTKINSISFDDASDRRFLPLIDNLIQKNSLQNDKSLCIARKSPALLFSSFNNAPPKDCALLNGGFLVVDIAEENNISIITYLIFLMIFRGFFTVAATALRSKCTTKPKN